MSKDLLSKHLLSLEVEFHAVVDDVERLRQENERLKEQLRLVVARSEENEVELSRTKEVVASLRKAVENLKATSWWRPRRSP